MRKSLLVNKITELIDLTNTLQRKLEALTRENAEMQEKISELESQKAALAEKAEKIPQNTDEASETDEILKEEHTEEPKSVQTEQTVTVTLDDMQEYGAKAIGKVVQESVKYANMISASTSNDKKELLNLIMGKAEITKAEIFSITEGELAPELKKELIDAQCDEAVDYFKSAYGQITE